MNKIDTQNKRINEIRKELNDIDCNIAELENIRNSISFELENAYNELNRLMNIDETDKKLREHYGDKYVVYYIKVEYLNCFNCSVYRVYSKEKLTNVVNVGRRIIKRITNQHPEAKPSDFKIIAEQVKLNELSDEGLKRVLDPFDEEEYWED